MATAYYRTIFTVGAILSNVLMLCAQKLLNAQTVSLRAPANVKIDGKANEWNERSLIHSKPLNLSYMITNDDENLYLLVQATHPRVIEKILVVGLTLIINNNGVKNEKAKDNAVITYPLLKFSTTHSILVNAGDKANWGGMTGFRSNTMFVETLKRTDSTVASANNALTRSATSIKISGLTGETDTLISIYNEQHIRVGAAFDSKGMYTYELSVPLKKLGSDINRNRPFVYGIRLNDWGNSMAQTFNPIDPTTHQRLPEQDADPDLNSTTYMWAEYTLAKKP